MQGEVKHHCCLISSYQRSGLSVWPGGIVGCGWGCIGIPPFIIIIGCPCCTLKLAICCCTANTCTKILEYDQHNYRNIGIAYSRYTLQKDVICGRHFMYHNVHTTLLYTKILEDYCISHIRTCITCICCC